MRRTKNIYHYHVKKCKKNEETIRKNNLLNACINGSSDIFEEIKKLRRSKPVVATSMDGNKDDIPGHFKTIYSQLYNSVEDKEELLDLKENVENSININSLKDVERVTPDIVKHGPDLLFKMLSIAIRSCLIHGHVTLFLLLATLLPIIKDK